MTDLISKPLAAALEVLYPHLESKDAGQALVAAKSVGLMLGYDKRWLQAPYRIDHVESLVTTELYNIESGARSRTFRLGGKIDVHATSTQTSKAVIFDHKTASQEIHDPAAPYWRQLAVEGQVSHYELLEWQNGRKVETAVWDVLRKPSIAPRLVAKNDRSEVYETQKYFGFMVEESDIEQLQETERETLNMYAARLAHDCMYERPQWYFQRREVPRLDAEIFEYASELWGHSQEMIQARRLERYPRNSGACMMYGSPCKFLGICSGNDTVDSDHWQRKQQVHVELPTLEGDGRDLLTTSRVRCFQTCRRKHYYQYELGIERYDEEEREALWFGTLFHLALERFFITLKQQQHTGDK